MKNIVAIVGMCGSGKSVVCEYLEKLGYQKLYFGGITYKLMKEAGIPINADTEREFRENLRKCHGPECYAKMIYNDLIKIDDKDIVLDGLYSWHEFTYLQNKLGDKLKLIAVICDKELRYDRISKRKERPFSFDKAVERDISEIENLFKGGPIAYADYFILNNGSIEEIPKRVDEILEDIESKK